jgi:hypothetical protein
MNKFRILGSALLLLAIALTGGCATTTQAPATTAEWDGLVRQPNSQLRALFVRPGAPEYIKSFSSVMLEPVQVSFASSFENRRSSGSAARRLNAADMAAIQNNLANLFRETFREELAAGGYALVDEPGPEVLRVNAEIVDLFIEAPAAAQPAGSSRTYTANSGRMTLVLEARDSVTGELLARAVDTRSGRRGGMMTVTNQVTNTADARRAIRVWAVALREGLDELYAQSN